MILRFLRWLFGWCNFGRTIGIYPVCVEVRARDNENATSFNIVVTTGSASADDIAAIFIAISDLNISMGGSGVDFKVMPESDDNTASTFTPCSVEEFVETLVSLMTEWEVDRIQKGDPSKSNGL